MGARRNSVSPKQFLSVELSLPPIEEQRRVVAGLDRLATKLADLGALRGRVDADLGALRRVMYSAAEKEARRAGESVPLSRIIDSHDSGWSPQCEEYPAAGDSWGVLRTTCVQWEGFNFGANKALRPALNPRPELTVNRGDILVTRAGPVNRVGVACAVPADFPRLMLSDKIVRLVVSSKVDPDFLVAMLGAPTAQEYLRQSKTGLAASQVNISRSRLLALVVPLPGIDVQRRLAASLLRHLSVLDQCAQRREQSALAVDGIQRSSLRLALR
jgi:type I restriction enzyme S subunit